MRISLRHAGRALAVVGIAAVFSQPTLAGRPAQSLRANADEGSSSSGVSARAAGRATLSTATSRTQLNRDGSFSSTLDARRRAAAVP
jgi:hypothetical protein